MTQEEFIDRTNLDIDEEKFENIHALYMASDCEKDEFCEAYVKASENPVMATIFDDAGAHLFIKDYMIKKYKKERDELARFIAEQAEVSSSSDLRAKAIDMMGGREYITWKIAHEKSLWKSDLDLIKRLLNE